jgi:hypothetical protein
MELKAGLALSIPLSTFLPVRYHIPGKDADSLKRKSFHISAFLLAV